jgi:predicted metal-dependent enzyme (double-stranded beta helix superfamily)
MHDALAHTQATGKEALRGWSDRVLALVDEHLGGRRGAVDPRSLATALAETAYWPASPRAREVAGRQATPYLRVPLADHPARDYEALLILWPPGHATPIHDHAGLWGIELVLDGVLAVEAFALSLQPAPRLVARDRTILGAGDHAAFSGADYAHRCRNLSAQQPALSLHVYGGGLDAYRSFHQRVDGDWVGTEHRAKREPALV